nr:mannose-binding lectin [Tanacetum cinerariifolium]
MDPRWTRKPRSSTPFLRGLGEFLDLECNNNSNGSGQIKCLCVKCAECVWVTRGKAAENVICNGIMEGYHTKNLQVCKEVAQVGIWGTKEKGSPDNPWHFRLEKNQKLKKISIDHGDLIFSLKFTTQDGRGSFHESKKAGGWNGGCQESEMYS